jgi:hypothetical protein
MNPQHGSVSKMNTIHTHTQELYPIIDMSPANAEIVELRLSNRQMLDAHHRAAESVNQLYKQLHPLLDKAATGTFEDAEQVEAFSGGIRIYEATGTLLKPEEAFATRTARTALTLVLARLRREDGAANNLAEAASYAVARLRKDAGLTHETISVIAERVHPDLVDYAIAGAAVARAVEIKTMRTVPEVLMHIA